MPSLAARQAMYSRNSNEAILALLSLTHPDFEVTAEFPDGVVRVVTDLQTCNSGGFTYQPAPFRLTLPQEAPDQYPRILLEVYDIAYTIGPAVQTIQGDIVAHVQLVLASTPNVIERDYPKFILRNARGAGDRLLQFDAEFRRQGRPWPGYRMDPVNFPGLF